MQSCVHKRLFSCSVMRRITAGLFHHVARSDGKRGNSLQYRFIKYLEEAIGSKTSSKTRGERSTPVKKPEAWRREHLPRFRNTRDTNAPSLSSILNQIENLESVRNPLETQARLRSVDKQSCRLLNVLSFHDILTLLNKLVETVPHRLAALDIYPKSVVTLRDMLKGGSPTSQEVINLLFLVSLSRPEAARSVSFVLKHLPKVAQLSLIEKCIISVATFRVGVKLSRNNVEAIEDTVHRDLETLMKDPGLFVSLLKALRYNGTSAGFSLAPISAKLLETERRFEISTAVPVLALYAEMLKADKNVVNRLVADSIVDVNRDVSKAAKQNSESFTPVRLKDVDRLLWATSRLNHAPTDDQLKTVEKFIDVKFEAFSKNPKLFARTVLSLWVLRSPGSRQLVEHCFQKEIFNPLFTVSGDDRLDRLNLLLDCVRIEAPEIAIPPLLIEQTKEKSFRTCLELETVGELLKCLAPHFALSDTRIDCPAKSLRIYGISTRHRTLGLIHIDMLNNVTCLRDTRKPNGLMSLKLRLVKALGYRSILLQNDGVIRIEDMVATIERSINRMSRGPET